MKKLILSFSAAALLIGMSSCEKIKNEAFPPFETNGGTILVEVPVNSNTTTELEMDATTFSFNLDSTIKANTGGNFSLSNASSVQVSSVTLDAINGDQENNISNFETAKVTVSSSSNPTPIIVASATIPDVNQRATINGNGAELKPYLQANRVTYRVSGKARRATTREIQATVTITLKVS